MTYVDSYREIIKKLASLLAIVLERRKLKIIPSAVEISRIKPSNLKYNMW